MHLARGRSKYARTPAWRVSQQVTRARSVPPRAPPAEVRDPTGGGDFPVHEVVLGSDHLIVENLCGVGSLPDRVRVGFFPLKISGDGAPVRAVAFT